MSHLPRRVVLLIAARAINQLGAFSLSFLTVVLVRDFGASLPTAGLIVSAFGVATIPSRLLGGRLADRFGRRRTIIIGLTGCAVAQLGIALAGSLGAATLLVVLLGLAFEVYEPATQAMIADAVGPSDRARAYNMLNAGLALAGMAAGLIATGLGRWDLRWLFVVDGLTCLACATIVWLALAADPPRVVAGGVGIATPWHDRSLLALLAFGAGLSTIYLMIIISLPLSLVQRGLRATDAGLLATISAITVVAGQPLIRRRWFARASDPSSITAGCVVLGIGLAGYALARTLPGYMAATVIWSVGDLITMGRAYAMVATLAPPGATGTYLAVYGIGWGIAAIVAPIASAQILDRAGSSVLWCWMAGGALALASCGRMLLPRTNLVATS